MNASLITMDSTESQAVATKFEAHATTVQEIITDIQNAIMNGLPGWQGAAKEAFVTQFTQLKPHLDQFVTLAMGQAQQMKVHTANVMETDAHGQRMMGYGG